MARYRAAVCRQCRREGIKLFLKGSRCFTDKCAIERRNYPPGQHGLGRTKPTQYGIQLREKQKAKRIYGVLEAQFRRYFAWAEAENVQVNGRKVSIPSFIVKVGEVVQLRPTFKMQERVADNLTAGRSPVPPWLDLDVNEKKGTVRGLPLREDIQIPVQEQLIVELFSK